MRERIQCELIKFCKFDMVMKKKFSISLLLYFGLLTMVQIIPNDSCSLSCCSMFKKTIQVLETHESCPMEMSKCYQSFFIPLLPAQSKTIDFNQNSVCEIIKTLNFDIYAASSSLHPIHDIDTNSDPPIRYMIPLLI